MELLSARGDELIAQDATCTLSYATIRQIGAPLSEAVDSTVLYSVMAATRDNQGSQFQGTQHSH